MYGRRHEDPLALEAAEPVGQDVRGDARQRVAQLAEPARAIEQRVDDEQRPAIADPVEGGFERGRRCGATAAGSVMRAILARDLRSPTSELYVAICN